MPKITAPTIGEHRAATVERLLDAYGELIAARGYTDVSLTDVAARAGLARTAVYNYFSNRESLLFSWTQREVAHTIDALQEALSEATSSVEKLQVFVRHELRSFATSCLPPAQEIVHIFGPETFRRFMQHVEPVERMLLDILREGSERREFAVADVASTVPLVRACIGAERGPVSTGEHDLEAATQRVTSFLLRALDADSRAPS